jgi:predicted RNase H-like HicB family nuclease
MKTYVFRIDLIEEEDGRWSAIAPDLPGCNAWGYTAQAAMEAVRDNAQAYIEVLFEDGEEIPNGIEIISSPAVAVTV